ncbi:MAG: cob(I)yrinic acid a,c-diamide adenosyltransferase [Nitrospirota bacterium]|nr:cob(I)yrinic acid a,c-diamide adenosyltransferase [Nitrospirota bacterium]
MAAGDIKELGRKVGIRITKVYTRYGDKGWTRLAGGKKVSKDHKRVAAYGTLDELNGILGIVRAFCSGQDEGLQAELVELVVWLQNELFDFGSDIATPPKGAENRGVRILEFHVERLEASIDRLNAELKPLDSFVLPGGSLAGAFLHQARTVARRAERILVGLSKEEPVNETHLKYINRMSDLLFVMARWANKRLGVADVLWQRKEGRSSF